MPPSRNLREDDILDAAQALLRSEGFAKLSARRLASALGVSRQVVYTHFGGMDGLLSRLHQRGSTLLAADIADQTAAPGSDAYLLDLAAAYAAAARARPALFALLFAAPVPGYTPDHDAQIAARVSFAHIVTAGAAWLAARRGRPAPDPQVAWHDPHAVALARALWATVHGHVMLEHANHATPEQTDQMIGVVVTALIGGWREG